MMNRASILLIATVALAITLAGIAIWVASGALLLSTSDATVSNAISTTNTSNSDAGLDQQPTSTSRASSARSSIYLLPTKTATSTPRPGGTLVPLTPIYPTDTPTPHTLSELAQASNGIAEVEVTSVYNWAFVARVERWLKTVTIPGDQIPSDPPNPPFLNIYLAPDDMGLVQSGAHYVVFIQEGDPYNWCQPFGYSLTAGSKGLYEIKDGMIAYAGLNSYIGKPVSELESDLLGQTPSGIQAQPTVLSDSGPNDLVQLVHASDLIIEAREASGEGSMGGVDLGFSVDKIVKGPSESQAIQDGKIGLRYMNCSNIPDQAGRHYILFLRGTQELGRANSVEGLGYFGITDNNMVTRGGFTHALGQIRTFDSLNHYAGWPLSKLEAAISDAMQAPYTPQPTPTEAGP